MKFEEVERSLYACYRDSFQQGEDLKEWIYRKLEETVPDLRYAKRKEWTLKIYESWEGLGPLEPLLQDPSVSEVMVNANGQVFYEREGTLYPSFLLERKEQEKLVRKMVSYGGREVNRKYPILDTGWKDGSRVHIVVEPICPDGIVITIRKFLKTKKSARDLVEAGAFTGEVADFLKELVVQKKNLLLSGGTGSGKTTLLNALTEWIPQGERIITIEDSCELQLPNRANLVRLEARPGNSSGAGQVTIRDLVRASLRMRPERIIIGEVRGPEALDMLQAMNTGHEGSISTAHANSPEDMISRLETMILMGQVKLPQEAVRRQIYSALDYIVQLRRFPDGRRGIESVWKVEENSLKEVFRLVEGVLTACEN